jgi:hypothetical protein
MTQEPKFSERDFNAPAWLYQMSSGGRGGKFRSAEDKPWYPSSYRKEVSEIEGKITWDLGKIYFRGQAQVSKGATIIFFFCKTGQNDPETGNVQPGIYGWGTITKPPADSYGMIEFEVKPPSDYLKNYVLWDDEIEQLTNQIRKKQYQGTMWPIDSDLLEKFREKIRNHIAK